MVLHSGLFSSADSFDLKSTGIRCYQKLFYGPGRLDSQLDLAGGGRP